MFLRGLGGRGKTVPATTTPLYGQPIQLLTGEYFDAAGVSTPHIQSSLNEWHGRGAGHWTWIWTCFLGSPEHFLISSFCLCASDWIFFRFTLVVSAGTPSFCVACVWIGMTNKRNLLYARLFSSLSCNLRDLSLRARGPRFLACDMYFCVRVEFRGGGKGVCHNMSATTRNNFVLLFATFYTFFCMPLVNCFFGVFNGIRSMFDFAFKGTFCTYL